MLQVLLGAWEGFAIVCNPGGDGDDVSAKRKCSSCMLQQYP